jgi:hypothetical protein
MGQFINAEMAMWSAISASKDWSDAQLVVNPSLEDL